MGGQFMVGVNAKNRALTGVAAGDEVDVDIELDTDPREVTVPPDFAQALAAAPEADRQFKAFPTATSGDTYSRSKTPRPKRPGRAGSPRRSTRSTVGNRPIRGRRCAGCQNSADQERVGAALAADSRLGAMAGEHPGLVGQVEHPAFHRVHQLGEITAGKIGTTDRTGE